MLWLALHFFRLALDTTARGIAESSPLAIASSSGGSATLVACNHRARACGVRNGMTLAAAWALGSELRIVVRDGNAERAALERIAAWAFEFTPIVSVAAPHEVLLEVEGSIGLFGGLARLHRRIERGLAELGYSARLACAPTPLAAQLFARAGLAIRIRHRDTLALQLRKLPVKLLDPRPEIRAMLESFGVRTIGECLELPRAGFARRLGEKFLGDIDRALGRLPDPRPYFVPPSTFNASLPLPAPVAQSEALLFGARRLLCDLCGWLAAIGKGVLSLSWALAHENCDSEHLLNVLRERLARVELPDAVTAITLRSGELQPLASRNFSLLPATQQDRENLARIIERLRARLGCRQTLY